MAPWMSGWVLVGNGSWFCAEDAVGTTFDFINSFFAFYPSLHRT